MFESIFYDIILCFIVLLLIIYYLIKDRYGYFKRRGIPYSEPKFLFGSTWRNVLGQENLVESCHRIYEENRDKKYLGIFSGIIPIFFITDPKLIGKMLINDFSNFHDRGIPTDEIANPLEGSLFNLKGSKWKVIRNKLSPAFSLSKLKGMLSTMNSSIQLFLDEFEQKEGQIIEMKTIFSRLNIHIVGPCAFGLDLDTIKNPESEFPQVCKNIFARTPAAFIKGIIRFFWPEIARFFQFRIIPKETNDFFMNLVKDSFEYRLKNGITRNDFLQLLLELREKGTITLDDKEEMYYKRFSKIDTEDGSKFVLTDEILTAQAFGFFSGGFETTSTALSFLFYFLSKNQNIQQKLRQEIVDTKEKYKTFSYEALKSMAYADACINESLRIYPPAGVLARKCNNRTYLNKNHFIEKDTLVFIPTYSIQRDEQYFPDPLNFKPERFINSEPSACTFLPFGTGPRICIAQRFAMMLMKVTIAEILLRYNITTCSKMSSLEPIQLLPRAFVTTPKDGLFCVFNKIEN